MNRKVYPTFDSAVADIRNGSVIMIPGFGPPGIVLLDMLFKVTQDISVFYIDTGFLFDQTYELRDRLQEKYGFKFKLFASLILNFISCPTDLPIQFDCMVLTFAGQFSNSSK